MVKFEANLLVLTRYILAIFSCLRAGIKRTTGFNYGGFFFFTDKCTLRKEDSESKRGLQESGDSMGHGTQATQGVGGYRRRAGSEHQRPVRWERSRGAGATVRGAAGREARRGDPKGVPAAMTMRSRVWPCGQEAEEEQSERWQDPKVPAGRMNPVGRWWSCTKRWWRQWWRVVSDSGGGDSNREVLGVKADVIYLKNIRETEGQRIWKL